MEIVNITNCCCNVQNYRNPQLKEVAYIYPCLTVLKLDYVILCGGIFDAICDGKFAQLKMLTVFVKEHDHMQIELHSEDWKSVVFTHPSLKVAFHFCEFVIFFGFFGSIRSEFLADNNCCYAHLRFFLKRNAPLTSISLCCNGRAGFYEQNKTCNIKRTLSLILRNYNTCLGM